MATRTAGNIDHANPNSAATPPVKSGEFPFPLTRGSKESPYLTWLRNHSNYMAARGLLDYLRAFGILVRGIIVNFLIFLPYLLVVAIILAYGHNWVLDHPFRLTLGALVLAMGWILIFPAMTPLFNIVTYRKSLETGSASSVKQRDRYERSFGVLVFAILFVALLESFPRTLVYLHDRIHLDHFGWKGLATVSAGFALFSSANKLLSVLGGMKKKVVIVLIGSLSLLVPLIVILYTTDFLVYGLPPSSLVMYSPLIGPVVGVVGIMIAIPLGLWQRVFTRKEFFAVAGLLFVASILVVTVIVESHSARKQAKNGVDKLDKHLDAMHLLAKPFEDIAKKPELTPEVASLIGVLVNTDREYMDVLNSPSQDKILEDIEDEKIKSYDLKNAPDPCASDKNPDPGSRNHFVQWPGCIARQFKQSLYDWEIDELQDKWNGAYFRSPLQLGLLAHKLSQQSDESLAPVRRDLTGLAYVQLLKQMSTKENDDAKVAELLRSRLIEQYLSPSSYSLEDLRNENQLVGLVRDRFKKLDTEIAVNNAREQLLRSAATDIAILTTEDQLFQVVKTKFKEEKALTAKLGGKEELAKLLTPAEMAELVFPSKDRAREEFVMRAIRLEAAVPNFPDSSQTTVDYEEQTRETAHALATLADSSPATEGPTESGTNNLAFFYGRENPGPKQEGPTGIEEPTNEEIARAAGEQLAKRALDDLDADSLTTLAFELADYKAEDLKSDVENAEKDKAAKGKLEEFRNLEKQHLKHFAEQGFKPLVNEKRGETLDEPYTWPAQYRFIVLFAGKALRNDTDELARLARESLIERAIATDTRVDDRKTILHAFGDFNSNKLQNADLARIAIAKLSLDSTRVDDLISTVMYGVFGRLDQGELAKIAEQATDDVMLPKVIFVALFAVVIWLLWWLTVDINLTSAHSLFRDRLAAAFLIGKDTKGDIGIEEEIDLDGICRYEAGSTAPYHLINVALNLQGSKDVGIRDRKSDFFIFSRRFTGGRRTGYCRSTTMEQVFPMDVATAMAISAAAASPNMGRATSPLLVALMTILNIRLGFWVPNPGLLEESLNKARWKLRKKDLEVATQPPGFTFEEVIAEELQEIEARWGLVYPDSSPRGNENRLKMGEPTVEHGIVGIGFSGGGIRSAALNLGIIQALHKRGVFDHLDYMSTVSGGGYLGSSISALMRSREKSEIAGTVALETEKLVSEIAGKVTIEKIKREKPVSDIRGTGKKEEMQGEQIVTVTTEAGEKRTYRYCSDAVLAVADGQSVSRGQLLLKYRDVVVTPSDAGDATTYRFSGNAILNVKNGDNISAGMPLLKPRVATGKSEIAGTVTVEDLPTGGYKVRVQGEQPHEHRDYQFSRLDSVVVATGDMVKVGDKLIQRYDTLGGRFSWRVRPQAYLREMLSKLDEKHRWVNLSDGGHIENLAAIELLRRRCRYIIIGDGEADPQLHFAGLATLMRYAHIDLGIQIEIDLDPIRLRESKEDKESVVSGDHWALGTITYPSKDGNEQPEIGHLLYLKSSFTGDEDEVIQEYRHRNPMFPHQSTAGQLFGEDQFEAYRALGQHIAEDALRASKPNANENEKMSFADFEGWFKSLQGDQQGDGHTRTESSAQPKKTKYRLPE